MVEYWLLLWNPHKLWNENIITDALSQTIDPSIEDMYPIISSPFRNWNYSLVNNGGFECGMWAREREEMRIREREREIIEGENWH